MLEIMSLITYRLNTVIIHLLPPFTVLFGVPDPRIFGPIHNQHIVFIRCTEGKSTAILILQKRLVTRCCQTLG